MSRKIVSSVVLLIFILSFYGCSYVRSSATQGLASNLKDAVLNFNDLETVREGGPAYLLMIDGLLLDDPYNKSLLVSAAGIYSAYTGVFVTDDERARRLTDKALDYGLRAVCARRSEACNLVRVPYEEYERIIASMKYEDVPALFALGSAWAGWIQARRDDLNAIAQLARVEEIMRKVISLNESYQQGNAHIYLGIMASFLPPALGGRPDEGRKHFERAIELSEGRNLMAKVIFAERYARLVFDRDLHDRLLNEVLDADPNVSGYTLINMHAQQKAVKLLATADDYF